MVFSAYQVLRNVLDQKSVDTRRCCRRWSRPHSVDSSLAARVSYEYRVSVVMTPRSRM